MQTAQILNTVVIWVVLIKSYKINLYLSNHNDKYFIFSNKEKNMKVGQKLRNVGCQL